ncbi:hypothetical protein J7L68_04740 [bacterium]|nr:hypothetical protein [bacterium]
MRKIFAVIIIGFLFVFGAELDVGGIDELLDMLDSPNPDFVLLPDYKLDWLFEELELRGEVPILNSISPYTMRQMRNVIDSNSDDFWTERTDRLLSPFEVKNNGFALWTPGVWFRKNSWNDKFDKFGKMNFGVGGTYGRWSSIGVYRMDSGYYSNPNYYGARWARVAGKSDQVYVRWSGKNTYFQIGKDYLKTGLGMAFSGNKPYERIQTEFNFGNHLNVFWSIGQLDNYVEIRDTIKDIYNRYIAVHRVRLKWTHFEVGFSELMLFGGMGRQIEMYYLMPFYAFHGEQLNHPWDDNTLWSLDMKVLMPPFRFRAEGILDDFQIDHEVPEDREPTEAGFAVQADYSLMSKPVFITQSLRYEMVLPRTFNQEKPWNRYLYENQPLGAILGNDFDKISTRTNLYGSFYSGYLELYHIRNGEGRIDDIWTEPWLDTDWSENFPTGVVERRTGFEISFWLDGLNWDIKNFSGQFSIYNRFQFEKISNLENVDKNDENRWELKMDFVARLWYSGF